MPIRPIDLQTLLMQMTQVAHDQAVEKDGPILQSAMHEAAVQKKEIETKESVRRVEEPKDGVRAVKDRQGRQRPKGGQGRAGGAEQAGEEEEVEAPREEVVRDPTLGNRVDLSG